MKMPPPPWELLATLNPSMLDGLQMKLLGNRLAPFAPSVQRGLASPNCRPPGTLLGPPGLLTTPVSSVVVVGNAPGSKPSLQGAAPWKSSPLASTVIPAPS